MKSVRLILDDYHKEYYPRWARTKQMAKDIVDVRPMPSPHNKKYWPHQAEVDWRMIKDIERWCYTHFKSGNWRRTELWIAFKREQDFVLFALRWL